MTINRLTIGCDAGPTEIERPSRDWMARVWPWVQGVLILGVLLVLAGQLGIGFDRQFDLQDDRSREAANQ